MIDRDYTLRRLKSKAMTPAEFNYETLSAPPLSYLFSREDIDYLYKLATSAKYSAQLEYKYNEIDKLMQSRGFEKLVSGTNRIAYAPTFSKDFIVKIAYDSVAINDSIREYRNQFLIKPFCSKVFEASPNGVLGSFERVNPITSRKEFISLAPDIFTLFSEFMFGDYLIDDIGTQYFNNIGFRQGFGAVVIDFPYVYKVDPKKIYCNKPDYTDPTGYCNGPIDCDLGFNKLICKKCGAVYKPFELAQKVDYVPLIEMKEKEIKNMKFKVSGGSYKKQEKVTGEFMNPVNVIKSNYINKKVEKKIKEEKATKTVNGVAEPKAEEVKETKEKKEEKATSPVVFNENLKGKTGDPGYVKDVKKEDLGKLLAGINNLYFYSDNTYEEKNKIAEEIANMIVSIFEENFEIAMKMFARIIRKQKSNIDSDIIKDFVDTNGEEFNDLMIMALLHSGKYDIETEVNTCGIKDDNIEFDIDVSINNKNQDVLITKDISAFLNKDTIIESLNIETSENTTDDSYNSSEANSLDLVNAVVVSRKDFFPNEEKGKVIVVKNDNDTYLTINDKIIAIDNLDGKNIDDIAVVTKDWYYDALDAIDLLKQAPVGSLPVADTEPENLVDDSYQVVHKGEYHDTVRDDNDNDQ